MSVCCCPLPDSPGTRLNQTSRGQGLIHKLSGEPGPQALIMPGTLILVLKAVTWHPALEFRFVEFRGFSALVFVECMIVCSIIVLLNRLAAS